MVNYNILDNKIRNKKDTQHRHVLYRSSVAMSGSYNSIRLAIVLSHTHKKK